MLFLKRIRSASRLRDFSQWLMQPLHFTLTLFTLAPIISLAFYVYRHAPKFPFQDMWWVNADPVVRVVTGKGVTFNYLLAPTGYSYLIFNRLISIFFGLTVHWNVAYEQYFNLGLGLASFIFLVLLFRRYYPSRVHLILVPFAALALSTRSGVMWLLSAEGWHLAIFFFLLGLVALAYIPGRWLALFVAGCSALCSALSFVVGLPAALVLVPAAWLMGYRKLKYQLFLFVILGIDAALYFGAAIIGSRNDITALDPAQSVGYHLHVLAGQNTAHPIGLFDLLGRCLSILGSSVAGGLNVVIPAIVALFAVGVLIANVVYLWQQEHTLNRFGVWLAIGLFAIVNVGLFAFRIQDSPDRKELGLFVRYAFLEMYFWISFVAISTLVLVKIFNEAGWTKQILAYLNIGVLVFALSTYLFTLGPGVAQTTIPFEQLTTVQSNDDCTASYPLDRNTCIFGPPLFWANYADYMAAYGLAGYADIKPILILPAAYKVSDEVIVSTESAWRDLHIRDWLLKGVPLSQILNMIPASEQEVIEKEVIDTPKPLENVFVGSEASKARTQTINSDQIWLIAGASQTLPDIMPAVEAHYRLLTKTDLPYHLVLYQFGRTNQTPQDTFNPTDARTTPTLNPYTLSLLKPSAAFDGAPFWSPDYALDLSRRPIGATYNENGTYHSQYFNVDNGIRRVVGQPQTYERTVWLFGSSTLFNGELPDEYTIASQIQKILPNFRVTERTTSSASTITMYSMLKEQTIKRGDIVVFFSGATDLQAGLEDASKPNLPFTQDAIRQNASDMVSRYQTGLNVAKDWVKQRGGYFVNVLLPTIWNMPFSKRELEIAKELGYSESGMLIAYPILWPMLQQADNQTLDLTHSLDRLRANGEVVFFDMHHPGWKATPILAASVAKACQSISQSSVF